MEYINFGKTPVTRHSSSSCLLLVGDGPLRSSAERQSYDAVAVTGGDTAVDINRLPGHIGCGISGEELVTAHHIIGFADPGERAQRFGEFRFRIVVRQHGGAHVAGTVCVQVEIPWCQSNNCGPSRAFRFGE